MKFAYKSIKFTIPDHKVIRSLAAELKKERGTKVYLPATVLEAVKFYREHRHDAAGTPSAKESND